MALKIPRVFWSHRLTHFRFKGKYSALRVFEYVLHTAPAFETLWSLACVLSSVLYFADSKQISIAWIHSQSNVEGELLWSWCAEWIGTLGMRTRSSRSCRSWEQSAGWSDYTGTWGKAVLKLPIFMLGLSLLRKSQVLILGPVATASVIFKGIVALFLALWNMGSPQLIFLICLIKDDVYDDHCLNKCDWKTYI